jgi:YD repeat-containing protein
LINIQNKYDTAFGDLIEVKNLTLNITAKKVYNIIYGLVVSETDPYGKISERQYNQKLQLVSQIQPDGKYNLVEYNTLGLVSTKSDFNAANVLQTKTVYEYNLQGQMIKQINLDGKFTSYTYDLAGNVLTSTVNINNSQSATTVFQYDEMNRLKKVISPKNEVTDYKYSNTGELIEIKDPKEKVTSFEYDEKGKLTKRIDPTGAVILMTYDNNGNMLTETDPANQLKKYKYNAVNKLTEIQTSDDLISYNYNVKDEVISMANTSSSILYTRDVKQRITSETVSATSDNISYPSRTIEYEYSVNDLRRKMTSPFQNINYFYNPNNYQLAGIQNSFGESFAFNYDEANRLASMTRPGSRTPIKWGWTELRSYPAGLGLIGGLYSIFIGATLPDRNSCIQTGLNSNPNQCGGE